MVGTGRQIEITFSCSSAVLVDTNTREVSLSVHFSDCSQGLFGSLGHCCRRTVLV